jgi:transcriptional regulator with XRE-family HTH domain
VRSEIRDLFVFNGARLEGQRNMNVQRSVYEPNSNLSKISPRGRLATGAPNPVDVHVGQRVRMRRVLLGMSQEKLGAALGLTFQQVQKYERGANRIGASRLWDLSLVLKCHVSYFFEDMGTAVAEASPRHLSRTGLAELPIDEDQQSQDEMIANREAMDMLRALYLIKDPRVRRRIRDLAKSLASAEEDLSAEERSALAQDDLDNE